MGHTLPCVVSLFLLLYCGPAKGGDMLTLEPDFSQFYVGESVTFKCNMKGNEINVDFKFTRNGQQLQSGKAHELRLGSLTPDMSGEYQCVSRHGNPTNTTEHSNTVTLTVAAHRPKARITADRKALPAEGSLTLSCSVDGSAGWTFWFSHNSTQIQFQWSDVSNFTIIYRPGTYWCGASRGNPQYFTEDSDMFRIEMSLSNRAVVKFQNRPNGSPVFIGETVTLICEIGGSGDTKWEYEWRSTSLYTPPPQREYSIRSVSGSHYGSYYCKGRKDLSSSTEWSEALRFRVTSRPTVVLESRTKTVPFGENATLTCSSNDYYSDCHGCYYYWFKYSPDFSQSHMINDGGPHKTISVSEGGVYFCRGGKGNPVVFTEDSNALTIETKVFIKPSLSVHPNRLVIFNGEVVTFNCWVYGGPQRKWTYELSTPNSEIMTAPGGTWNIIVSEATRGIYRCLGNDQYVTTEWSDPVSLVSFGTPKVSLSSDTRTPPPGGRVTLTCSVTPSSSGWTFYWYRGEKTSVLQTTREFVSSVSEEGLYWCRGGRGDPVYYTEYSNPVSIDRTIIIRATVRIQHQWPCIHHEEAATIRCDIEDGGDAEWEYEWETTNSQRPLNQREFTISSKSDTVEYWCKGRKKSAQHVSTGWSSAFQIPECYGIPEPVLTVSQSWLSPGNAVTLTCQGLESGGWRFYWYKAVPKLNYVREYPYRYNFAQGDMTRVEYHVYELLPGSVNGTTQNFYVIHGQTRTAGYLCRGGRGDPVYYTEYSEPTFVWSGDLQSSLSLKVNPDRAQHFSDDDVFLSCEGNATEWRVMWSDDSFLSPCYMSGNVCRFSSRFSTHRLYWCESGSGEFSSAVNITISEGIVLLSPVHSVNEGDSVILGCKLKTGNISRVAFYKNDKLIQNDSRLELNISAVSKSDEGFYKCESSGFYSQLSWVAVTSASKSSFSAWMTIWVICVVVLVLLLPLLVLCCFKKSKDICCKRSTESQGNELISVRPVNEDENQQQLYSSLLHGDLCIYESVAGSRNTDGP